ncbi:MAG: TetR/AcrR family transcriptional regulator [Candidatus Hydrogenedentes bacterium]|nr:TetR/AcrR family transcriptional regulator [Candidatus Hydrogenedentota bacterium]
MATETAPSTRRNRNKLRHRQEITAAALVIFAEKGYREASIQEIADRADFAVSTIYALFENKEDLYRSVSRYVAKYCGDLFDRAMSGGTNEYEKLLLFARAKGQACRELPDGVRLLNNEQHGPLFRPVLNTREGITQFYEGFILRIRDLFAAGIKKGLFVEADPELLAIGLEGITNALVLRSFSEQAQYTYEDRIDEILAVFFGPVLKDKQKQ